jgi:alpha-L-fucosidase
MKNVCCFLVLYALLAGCAGSVEPPASYGALPDERQLRWQEMEYYMFVHFGPNTFTDVEWGDGKENPEVFNPTALDCRQWAATAKAAGMKGIIITAKHHDGFCLWPSAYSAHTVRESKWKDGKGDVLRELSDACREYGLKFGVYLSPWDRNHPAYGTPEYNQVFVHTLTEVLTGYGEVFEQWFDGANGDERKGTKRQVYDWPLFHRTVYTHQPQAVIFSDVGPGCRWMGNEKGVAGETNWSTLNTVGFEPGLGAPPADTLNTGNRNGSAWVPAETDVSIRPGWFYSQGTDDKVKTVKQLMDIYYTSVGRNANLLLNVPPNREGRIHPNDSTRLMEFRRAIDGSFAVNLLQGAKLKATDTRGNSSLYAAANLLNGMYDSYWATKDDVQSASVEITLNKAETFNCFLAREYIPLGQRIARFSLEAWDESTSRWQEIATGTTIGNRRILRFPQATARKLRFTVDESLAPPVLTEIGLFLND